MGNKSHFFRQKGGLKLLADYQFNNNLIDDANGYNLTGSNITYDNGSAVFNGSNSEARRTDANDIFSFTDGVNDLPFRIELVAQVEINNEYGWILSKRDGSSTNIEWQVYKYLDSININLFSNNGSDYITSSVIIDFALGSVFNIVIEYDGKGIKEGLNITSTNSISTSKTQGGNYTGMVKTQSDLLMGQAGWGSGLGFTGKIDYLKIYK